MKVFATLFFLLCTQTFASEPTSALAVESQNKPLLTILYSAEAHAALLPCDCPLQPLGGVARRATLIKQYRQRGSVLLLDGGGWGAGGMFDEDSDGDTKRDALRTELMARAMKLMKYDFIAVGPQESSLVADAALASAVPARLARPRSGEIKIEGFSLPIQVSGWSEPGTPIQGSPAPEPPATWDRLASKDKHSLEIHLARLGEVGSEALASVVESDLVLSAGRKTTQRISWMHNKTPIVNFDYQAQRLIVIEVYSGKNTERLDAFRFVVRQEVLDKNIADDPEITALLLPHLESLKKKSKHHVEAEFWTMPECPGCLAARPNLQRIASEFSGRVNFTLHFVVHKDEKGQWVSLHGDRELQEARVQAIVQKYYPEKIWEWLEWREQNLKASWEEGARKFEFLPARIRGALASGEAEKIFAADNELQSRRNIDGTPTLIIANRTFEAALERLQILRVFCSLLDAPAPVACKDVPACFFDAQCRKRGFIGKCVDAGKPLAHCDTSRAAVKVPAVVITDKENIFDNHERILEALLGDLPGLDYRILDLRDEEARTLLAQSKITRLPAYFFDPIAATEVDYEESIGKVSYLDRTDSGTKGSGKIIVRSMAVAAHRIVGRERIKGRIDLFAARLSKNGSEALEAAITHVRTLGKNAPDLRIHDAVFWNTPLKEGAGEMELAAPGGIAELEEAARGLALKKLAPEKHLDYLLEAAKKRGSSWWDAPLKAIGLGAADAEKIRALSEGPTPEILALLQAEATLLKSLDAHGEIIVLVENVELIPIRSRQDLRELLDKVAQRK